jgi:anthranilate phosphoribosyltransferase
MSISHHLRQIGRGRDGARSLDEDEAHELMSHVLDGRVTDLELGAFVLAMRIKGESVAELRGFLRAAHERCLPIAGARPCVLLPSYNGARRLPNLTALLALLLSQEGVDVLVHGPMQDATRTTTAAVFHDLGLPIATRPTEVEDGWSRREPVFIPIDALCPPLARLLAVRQVVGLRNSGHTIAKLLRPCRAPAVLQVVNHTHPDYATTLRGLLEETSGNALLLRGTEGEPVADPRRSPRLDIFLEGVQRPDLSRPAQDGVLATLPLLPRGHDATSTAHYIQSVVSGEKPAPAPLTVQVECLVQALAAQCSAAASERSA